MNFLLICVFLVASFSVAVPLKCYKCMNNCESTPTANETVTCRPDETKCFKGWHKTKSGHRVGLMLARNCAAPSSCDNATEICEQRKKRKGYEVDECGVECCGSDLCNTGGPSEVPSHPSLGVLLVPGFVSLCSAVFAVAFF